MNRLLPFVAILLAVIGLTWAPVPAGAQGVRWSASGPTGLVTPPGDVATYVLHVWNDRETATLFKWRVELPPGWTALSSEGRVEVPAGGQAPVFVSYFVPDTALAGLYAMSLSVTRPGTNEDRQWEAGAEVPVRRGLALEQGAPPTGYPGERVEYGLVVRNRGNAAEELLVELTVPDGWSVDAHQDVLHLAPGERGEVSIPVQIGHSAQVGLVSRVQAKVRTGDGAVKESLALAATVRPPHPDLVPQLRADTLPATVRFNSGPMREGRSWDPELTLSARGRVGEDDDREIIVGAGIKQDEQQRVFVKYVEGEYRRDPYSLRIGLRRNRITQPLRERLTLTYNERPWWWSIGDVSIGLSPLVSPSGRGGALRFFQPEGADYGAFALGDTVGLTLGARFGQASVRFTALDGNSPNRPVFSLYGQLDVTDETTLQGETVTIGGDRAWFVGAAWRRAPWGVSGRYLWYGLTAVPGASGEQSGFDFALNGTIARAPFSLIASDIRTNVLRDPSRPVEAISRAALTSSFPIGQAAWRGSLRWDQVQTLVVPPGGLERDRATLSSEFTLQRRLENWYWIVRGTASAAHDRPSDTYDAGFSLGPAVGRAWPTVRAEVGVVVHGTGETLSTAWDQASVGPSLGLNWRPRTALHPEFRFEYFGGDRARIRTRVSLELTDALDFYVSADARYYGAQPEWTYRAGLTYRFGLPVPGVYSRGNMEGQVYVMDGAAAAVNGHMEGIVVRAGDVRVSTDADGRFVFPPLRLGEYEVALENLAVLGIAFEPQIALPMLVEVETGETAELAIPIKLMAQMTGRVVFASVQGSDVLRSSLAGVELEWRRDGALAARAVTDRLGFYETPMLDPGTYELSLVQGTLPRWTVSSSPLPVRVDLEPGRIVRHDIGLDEIEVPIRVDVDL